MAYVEPDKYSPYPRVCDICGVFKSVATMRKLDGQTYVCERHTGERTSIMLDTLNAHARVPQTWPTKDPKPQNPLYPASLEAEDGAVFDFLDRMVQAQCRFETVDAGQAPFTQAPAMRTFAIFGGDLPLGEGGGPGPGPGYWAFNNGAFTDADVGGALLPAFAPPRQAWNVPFTINRVLSDHFVSVSPDPSQLGTFTNPGSGTVVLISPAPTTTQGGAIPGLSWAARYLYDLIQQNTRTTMIPRAKVLLAQIATYLQTRQQGFGLTPTATLANYAPYGGFLALAATNYIVVDTATAGLALLYAYRVLGTPAYLAGARAAASFLRNVQSIGSNGSQFTSRNAAGTARLYTGAVCSEVSTLVGIEGEFFYSNHLFYPSGLVALELWNELLTTDGDQSIGSTATPEGFATVPSKLMSDCIDDMREFWENGVADSAGQTYTGLSETTPREFFNAYPATKVGFSSITGTGRWEYANGGATTGTQITSQNFAGALSALYNYEGASTQVTTISDWLRSFTSNPDFETADDTSEADLARETTGDYDPTECLATLLQVRDPDTLAADATNASSVYDWGSFGLMARIWASRNRSSFMLSRIGALNVTRRYHDGVPTDGLFYDRISTRGLSGLTFQTGPGTEEFLALHHLVNDAVRAAQFGRTFREAR